jgi:hypothetical protein
MSANDLFLRIRNIYSSLSEGKKIWLFSGIIILSVFLTFGNCIFNSFVWDDEQFVVRNVFLNSAKYFPKLLTENIVAGAGLESNLYRPLQSLTHFLDVLIYGYSAWGHHLSNVLFLTIASVLIFRLLISIFSLPVSFFCTLLFVLHPVQSEAVAYVSGRNDILGILFLSLGLITFQKHYFLSLFSAASAMFSKESMVLFPVFLFLFDRLSGKSFRIFRHIPFWLLSGIYVISRLTLLNFQNTLNFYNQDNVLSQNYIFRFFTYLTTIPRGLMLWFFPYDLHHERSWSVFTDFMSRPVLLSFSLVMILIIIGIWSLVKRKRLWLPILWFFAATFPTSNLLVLINALFYDHWFILPGFGIIISAGIFMEKTFHSRMKMPVSAAAGLIITVLALLSYSYNKVWRDPVSLYSHILFYEPDSAKICNNLAMAYSDKGDNEKAAALYQKAIALDDTFPQTHHNLANIYLNSGKEDSALSELQKAVKIKPGFHHSWILIGVIYLNKNLIAEAKIAFDNALKAYPYDHRAYLGLVQVYMNSGDLISANKILQTGMEALPDNPELRSALSKINL